LLSPSHIHLLLGRARLGLLSKARLTTHRFQVTRLFTHQPPRLAAARLGILRRAATTTPPRSSSENEQSAPCRRDPRRQGRASLRLTCRSGEATERREARCLSRDGRTA